MNDYCKGFILGWLAATLGVLLGAILYTLS